LIAFSHQTVQWFGSYAALHYLLHAHKYDN